MAKTLVNTEFNFKGQKSVYHGKVRDVYDINDDLLVMVATDRISAFDVILPKGIPFKGQVLNQIASSFLDATADIVPNWKLATPDPMVTVGLKCEGFKVEEHRVSSTVVRNLLYAGDVAEAQKCLGRPYTLTGTVVKGRQVGRELGFPTANLRIDTPFKLIPAGGVYAVWAEVEGKRYSAVLNIGNRPTLDNGQDMSIEVHLFDFDAQIYGASVSLEFVEHLREEQCFATLDDLKAQIHADCEMARGILV